MPLLCLTTLLLGTRPLLAAEVLPTSVPAQGAQEVLIRVERFGRYALEVDSPLGAALQLVDAMDGPGGVAGVPGERDGRLDVFLDVGEHRLRVFSPAQATDPAATVRVRVTPAQEQLPSPMALPELGREAATLADHQQRSWWIQVSEADAARPLLVEVAGRHLADLRLWRDGDWLTADTPRCAVRRPVPEQPVRDCVLETRLSPGLYQLVAYGGPGETWADGSTDAPLYIRRGVPHLDSGSPRTLSVSPFGVDYWRVDAEVARLELPEVGPSATLELWEASSGLLTSSRGRGELTPKSRLPAVQVSRSGSQPRYLAVTAPPGQTYTLRTLGALSSSTQRPLPRLGTPTWLSVHGLDEGADQIEWTGMVLRQERGKPLALEQTFAVPLQADRRYLRRFNARSREATLLVEVTRPGSWRFAASGADAQLQVTPFLLKPDPSIQPSPRTGAPQTLPLSPGLYVVQVWADAEDGGTVSLDIRPEGADDTLPVQASRARIQLPQARFDESNVTFTLSVFGVTRETWGLVQRSYPLDLEAPLAVSLLPGEVVDLPVTLPALMALRVTGDERDIAMSVSNGTIIAAGERTLRFRNDGREVRNFTVALQRTTREEAAPLLPLPGSALQARPELPLLTADAPYHHTYAQGEAATVRLRVTTPGLYEIVSEGLLQMQGTVRTRTVLELDQQAANGAGRNFRVQQYLRPGDYKVTAQPLGASAGHATLRLRQTTLHDGGVLLPEQDARIAQVAGDGVVYRLQVPEAGTWRIQSITPQGTPRCRLEDADGWPVIAPNQAADLAVELEAGAYRLVLLPSEVDQQRVTSLARVRPPEVRAGHGPFRLPLAQTVTHRWTEPQDGGPRSPDLWTFDLAAPAEVSLDLSDGMTATLSRGDEALSTLGGPLEAGSYRVEVRSLRPDHGREYTLQARAVQLTPGEARACSAPCTVPISTSGGPLELRTEGRSDVRLTLSDAAGRVVAASDDRPGDWNAQVFAPLPAGIYQAEILPVGAHSGQTTLLLSAPPATTGEPLAVGGRRTLTPGDGLVVLPLAPVSEAGTVLLARAEASEGVGIAIVQGGVVLDRGAGSDARAGALPVPGQPAELWVWSLDRRGGPVRVTLADQVLRQRRDVWPQVHIQNQETAAGQAAFALETSGPLALSPEVPADLVACWEGRPCLPVPDDRLAASAVVVVKPHDAATPRLGLLSAPVLISGARSERVTVPADAGVSWRIDAPDGGRRPWATLIEASTSEGTPIVRMTAHGGTPAVAPQRSSTAHIAERREDAAMLLWADGAAQVRAWHFARPGGDARPIAPGQPQDIMLPPGEAVRLRASSGDGPQLTLSLPVGVAAVVERPGDEEPLLRRALSRAETFVLDGPVDAIVLLNPADAAQVAQVTLGPRSPGTLPATLTPGQVAEGTATRRETIHLAIPALEGKDGGWSLRLVGAVEEARWIGRGGDTRVLAGAGTLPVSGGAGEVVLRLVPGQVAAWLVAPSGESSLLAAGTEAAALASPGTLVLDGTQGAAAYALRGQAAQVLRVMPEGPLLVELASAGEVVGGAARRLAAGESAELVLPAGEQVLRLRGAAGLPLRGTIQVEAPQPLAAAEGQGAPLVVAPGQPRWLAITVPDSGAAAPGVGVGVSASTDRVQAHLFSEAGAPVGAGVGQLHALPPGRYLLALSVDAVGEPATVRVGLVGLTPPDGGPPAAVQQEYRGGEAGR